MNKKERVDAALRGDTVDRVPASLWSHDYEREWGMQSLTDALIENFTRYDWDFLKVTPRASYIAEGWKARYRPSGEKYTPPIFETTPVQSTSDWRRLRPQEPDQGALNEQLRVLQLLNHVVGYDAYFVQTIFCPLAVTQYLIGNQTEFILHTIHEDRAAMHMALRVITETLVNYAIACLEQGASGIFYATNGWASAGRLTQDQYREFGEQYDLEILDAIKSRSKFNILHNSGQHIYFDLLASYPVQAISWSSTSPGNPDLREGQRSSGKAVMGGLDAQTLQTGSPDQVQEETARALEATNSKHLLLTPGCTVSPETPTRNIEAIRRMLS